MTLSLAGSTPISALVGDPVLRVAPDATLREIAQALTRDDVGILAVGDDPITGVVSERDVIHAIATGCDLDQVRAADLAEVKLVWCDASAKVADVATEMLDHWIRHVLVESKGRLLGVVSARDLLGVYSSADVPLP